MCVYVYLYKCVCCVCVCVCVCACVHEMPIQCTRTNLSGSMRQACQPFIRLTGDVLTGCLASLSVNKSFPIQLNGLPKTKLIEMHSSCRRHIAATVLIYLFPTHPFVSPTNSSSLLLLHQLLSLRPCAPIPPPPHPSPRCWSSSVAGRLRRSTRLVGCWLC